MPKVWNKRDPATPRNAVYVGRPSLYGNPFVVGQHGDRQQCVRRYKHEVLSALAKPQLDLLRANLRGKDLVCWCVKMGGVEWTPAMTGRNDCHCFPLMEIANQELER